MVDAAILASAFVVLAVATPAEARGHHHYRHHTAPVANTWAWTASQTVRSAAHIGGRPRAWCGWQMRQWVSSDPGESYNLARNWAHYGSAASGPGVGVIVVWRHHVGRIVGGSPGNWIIESGNDGGQVRTRVFPLGAFGGPIAYRVP